MFVSVAPGRSQQETLCSLGFAAKVNGVRAGEKGEQGSHRGKWAGRKHKHKHDRGDL